MKAWQGDTHFNSRKGHGMDMKGHNCRAERRGAELEVQISDRK